MFRIKICGITSSEDAQLAFRLGADAIGLNFYPQSKRHVSYIDANFICQDVPANVMDKVGVFVNASIEDIRETVSQLRLDYIQLHGDESIEFIQELKGYKIIRAIRPSNRQELAEQIEILEKECDHVKAILVDAFDPNEYGGTGKRADWNELRLWTDRDDGIPVILAGGLTPESVGTAIETVRPAAIDVASGVESAPGVKDADKLLMFVDSAQASFAKNKEHSAED